MHIQVLGSGSEGNAMVLRAGDINLMVDAGLGVRVLSERFELAHVGPRTIDHLFVTHGHLDHARNAGAIAKRQKATLHCSEKIMGHRSISRAPEFVAFRIGQERTIEPVRGTGTLTYCPVLLPHDCDPTVGLRFEHEGRVAVVLTDIGRPDAEVARQLQGAALLVLEFNYDPEMLREGPYPPVLQQRISGGRGHLSNDQAADMLEQLACPDLHTVVLAHISQKNNTPQLAEACARAALERMGRPEVKVVIASQHEVGDNLEV
ncbi:MAG: phosphoribosyl 1,2-cyclic phosphodiesterase [Candidatus Paceibacteria bacterium]|jgi:phosphoribosyl 1,2-cyclic phosphodiesterase